MPLSDALQINAERLWHRLMALAQICANGKGGVDRQALTDGEHQAWHLVIDWARDAGLEVTTDPVANLFLTLPGKERHLPPILIGSHLDTQPTGGRFDGAFGVMAALEVATTISESNLVSSRDIVVVAWMNEEGSRFAPGMMGSEAFAKLRPLDVIRAVTDRDGISAGAEIDRIHAAFPDIANRPLGFEVGTYIEPHIEQDSVLEREEKVIGVVTGIQGKKTFEIEIAGTKGHAGTLPMSLRRDAVMAFARIAETLEREIGGHDDAIKFTIGQANVYPNAPSVIPDRVVFRVDLRHPDNEILDRCGHMLRQLCEKYAKPCTISIEALVSAPSNGFDAALQQAIAFAARKRNYPDLSLISFAGHDARHLAELCPSAMIFIPCKDGISHDEKEWSEPDHVAAGAQVLLDVVLEV